MIGIARTVERKRSIERFQTNFKMTFCGYFSVLAALAGNVPEILIKNAICHIIPPACYHGTLYAIVPLLVGNFYG